MTRKEIIKQLLEALELLNDDYETDYVINKYIYPIWAAELEWKEVKEVE